MHLPGFTSYHCKIACPLQRLCRVPVSGLEAFARGKYAIVSITERRRSTAFAAPFRPRLKVSSQLLASTSRGVAMPNRAGSLLKSVVLLGLTLGGGMIQACGDDDGPGDEAQGGGGATAAGASGASGKSGSPTTAGRGEQEAGAGAMAGAGGAATGDSGSGGAAGGSAGQGGEHGEVITGLGGQAGDGGAAGAAGAAGAGGCGPDCGWAPTK